MLDPPPLPLDVVDGRTLPAEYRRVLCPGEPIRDAEGRARRLPRFFYAIPTWEQALKTQLTPHFGLWELIDVDVREAEAMRTFPRYVPCAITLLAAHLEIFRVAVGGVVRVAANGGYRSPAHACNPFASPHSWGTAANVYRVGDELMDSEAKIEKFTEFARDVLPGVWTRPFGSGPEDAFDHVHLSLGYATVVPLDAPAEADDETRDER